MSSSKTLSSVAVCSLTTFLVNVDNTAYQVASPSIIRDMGIVSEAAIWIIGSFTLTLATLELYTGRLGDSLGRKRLLIYGLCVYCAGAIVVAVSSSLTFLLAGRIISGLGGAALVPMGLAILRDISTSSSQLHKFTSYWGISVGLGLALGPLVGGVCSEFLGWRSLPAGTALFATIFLIIAAKSLPNTTVGKLNTQYDIKGIFLLTIAVTTLTFVVIAQTVLSLVNVVVFIIIAGAALVSVFLRYRFKGRDPLPSPGHRGRLFLPSVFAALINYLAFGCAMFVMSVGLLQNTCGISPAVTGILMLPIAIGYSLGSRMAPVLISRWGLSASFVIPSIVGAITLLAAMFSTEIFQPMFIVPAVGLVLGLVVGALNAPTNSLAMSQIQQADSGLAGAYASTSRQVGQSIGVAFGGVAASSATVSNVPASAVWAPSLLCFVVIGLIGMFILRKERYECNV